MGVHIVGKLPKDIWQNEYIITVIDYFTKWVEKLSQEPEMWRQYLSFEKTITYQFRVHQEIMTNNTAQFTSSRLQDWYEELGIRLLYSLLRYYQTNSLVEPTNKTIVGRSRQSWMKKT